jgi:DNA-binding response OmpR family regulator
VLDGIAILAVDDDDLLLSSYARAFRKHGARVLTASGVQSARRILARDASQLDALLLDYVLTDGDAREVVDAARSAGCPAGLVVVTGQSCDVARHAAIRFGACAALLKPCATTELIAGVQLASETAQRRRRPTPRALGAETPALGDAMRILDAVIALLRRAGLGLPEAQALRCRAQGFSVARAAKELGISSHRLRARLSDGLGDIGADSAYALLGVLAGLLAQVIDALAGNDVAEAHQLLTRAEVLIASAPLDVRSSEAAPSRSTVDARKSSVAGGMRPRARPKRAIPHGHGL